jgi:hypothetical protein
MVGMCNIPTFDKYMLKLPNFFICLQKFVKICEVGVLSLGFRVTSRLCGYISWFYIDFNFLCCCIDYIGTYKVVIFCSIWCWALAVFGHELGQVTNLSLCPFSSDQIHVALHLFNYDRINYKVFASCARFEEFHANFISRNFSW